MANVTDMDIERVEFLLHKLLSWAGVDDDTRGSVEILTIDNEAVSVDDVYDSLNVLTDIKIAINDGRLKDI